MDTNHLQKITCPADLRRLGDEELTELAEEIREFIVETVNTNGGHLGSNLGVVELTLALHLVFDSPRDIILWDTGHQAYVHKMLTGRTDQFESLRKPRRAVGIPESGGVPPRLDREQPRVHRIELRPRPGHRPRGRRRRAASGYRGGGRRLAHRGRGLRGAQQHRTLGAAT